MSNKTLKDILKDPVLKKYIKEYHRKKGKIAILAYHAGGIEEGTEQIARYICENSNASLYVFSGIKKTGNRVFHIDSHRIKKQHSPLLKEIIDHVDSAISIHKTRYTSVFIGGCNRELAKKIGKRLKEELPKKYSIIYDLKKIPYRLRGIHPNNIVNQATPNRGVQIELPPSLACASTIAPIINRCAKKGIGKSRHQYSELYGDTLIVGKVLSEIIKEEEKYNQWMSTS
ncbi:MAG: poly-gamma-glutamate hydrolase family protein [Methanosarcinales archaeon]